MFDNLYVYLRGHFMSSDNTSAWSKMDRNYGIYKGNFV